MKKRLLFISLALALVLMTVIPALALTDDEWTEKSTSFIGSGLLYVTNMPLPIAQGHTWCYEGEIVQGFLDQSSWDLLTGAEFYSVHDSVVRVDNSGNATGSMKGTFTLTQPVGTLEGNFSGEIKGNLFTGDIVDKGTWRGTKGTGVFTGVKAQGQWSADLHLGTILGIEKPTLIGPLTWEGKYISTLTHEDDEDDDE